MVRHEGGVTEEEVDLKKKKRGRRIGKPADWTNVAIHLLFPPLS